MATSINMMQPAYTDAAVSKLLNWKAEFKSVYSDVFQGKPIGNDVHRWFQNGVKPVGGWVIRYSFSYYV